MLEIAFFNAQPLVRRALIGARADDPVLPERQPRRRQAGAGARKGLRRRTAPALRLKPRGTS
jgi:hypothetical protein